MVGFAKWFHGDMRGAPTSTNTWPTWRSVAALVAFSLLAAGCGSDAVDATEAIAPTASPESTIEPEPRPALDEPTPAPAPTAADARPLTASVQDIDDLAELPSSLVAEPPAGTSLAVGTFVAIDATAGETEFYVVDLARDSDWSYVQDGQLTSQRHLTQDAVTIRIAAQSLLIRNCPDGPADPARVEVRPAGPLSRVAADDGLHAAGWLTITCLDVDLADVDEARARWVASEVNVYRHHLRGRIDGEKVTVIIESADGVIRQRRLDTSVGRYDIDSLFDQIVDAIVTSELTATVFFDPELGHPVEVQIAGPAGEILFLETRAFGSKVREPACEVGTGSALDLSAEPVVFVISRPDYQRWYDPDGCPVRIDIISDRGGPTHCEWDRARFLAFSDPIGAEPTRSFLWDPDGTLDPDLAAEVGDVATTVAVADLSATAAPTGYRGPEGELWLDSNDPSVAFVVDADRAQIRRLIPPDLFLCA